MSQVLLLRRHEDVVRSHSDLCRSSDGQDNFQHYEKSNLLTIKCSHARFCQTMKPHQARHFGLPDEKVKKADGLHTSQAIM